MKEKRKETAPPKRRSLKRHLMLIFWGIAVPMVLILAVLLYYSAEDSRSRLARSAESNLQLFSATLTKQMESVEDYMLDLSLNNERFRRLGEQSTRTQAYLDTYEIAHGLPPILAANDTLMGMILYSRSNNIYVGEYGSVYGNSAQRLQQKLAVEDQLIQLDIAYTINTTGWYTETVEDRLLLLRSVSYHTVYLTTAIDLNMVFEELTHDYGLDGTVLVYDNTGKLLIGDADYDQIDRIHWDANGYGTAKMQGKSLLAVENTVQTLKIYYLTPYGITNMELGTQRLLLILATVVVMMAIPFLLYYMRQVVFKPMSALVETMGRIGRGDLSARPDADFRNAEFVQVNETFNQMIDQITTLKIDRYEQELEAKRNEMTALKLQIRPHFILNCLKNIYALAQTGSTADIQTLILLLSRYLRYILSYTQDTIPLKVEIEQCCNYADLSGVGQVGPVEVICDIDKALAEMPVPPVSMLTLVENSVKHGRVGDRTLQIWLAAKLLKSEECCIANLSVTDNGNGFSQQDLQQLNGRIPPEQDGNHVGLYNVIRRLRFQYGEKVEVAFANGHNGGARVELFIPLGAQWPQEKEK